MTHRAGGARHPQAIRRRDDRRSGQRVSAALGPRFMWRSSTCSVRHRVEVLRELDGPAVVVPAFLSRGYHVNTDIPAHVAASGHPRRHVTERWGRARSWPAYWPTGSSNLVGGPATPWSWRRRERRIRRRSPTCTRWRRGCRRSPARGSSWRSPPPVTPSVADAVAQLRRRGARRVVVASYLLSDGLFQDRLRASGADVVTEPLGTHAGVVRLIASRFRRARLPIAA